MDHSRQSIGARLNDLMKAEEDIASIKKFLAGVAISVFGVLFGIGVWVGSHGTKLDNLESTVSDLGNKQREYENRQRDSDIVVARVDTKLSNIETTLAEIKQQIR